MKQALKDIFDKMRDLALFAAKALMAAAAPILTMFAADALDVLSRGGETAIAAAVAAVAVYFVPNRSLNS